MKVRLVKWREYDVTPNEKKLLEHIIDACHDGVTADDVRYLLEGDVLKARKTLSTLAKKRFLKKRKRKERGLWDTAIGYRSVAYYYPIIQVSHSD